jgi:hypothetical protein
MSSIRFSPGGIPISSSQAVSASVCFSAGTVPPTSSFAEWANSPSGSNGSPFVRTIIGSVVLIGPPPPGPTPTPPPECPDYGTILTASICSGPDLVNIRANGTCGQLSPEIICSNIQSCGGTLQGCE